MPKGHTGPITLSEFNFGEYDARREFLRSQSYFMETFIDPISFPLGTLSNKTNYIIVGQKGAGKTACQLYLESDRAQRQGYLSGLISFYDDLTPDDYTDFASTQRMNLISLDQLTSIESQYDFKEVWKRILFIRIAKILQAEGFSNSFTAFCLSTTGGTNSIIDGIKKSLKVEVKVPLHFLETKLEFDPSKLAAQSNELTVPEFNRIAEQLLVADCVQYRLYFFVDELVISNLNTKSDEYRARLCLIRDIVRTCCYLNDFCVTNDLDMHFICNLRPEIRTKLNELDPEISKVMDGNDVFLGWDRDSLLEILTQKIVVGAPRGTEINADEFIPKTINFGHPIDFMSFLLNNSWFKPRDMIRFLKVYAKVHPRHTRITEEGTKECLNEYARISATELFEQISVQYPANVLAGIRMGIRRRRYSNANDLAEALKPHVDVDPAKLVEQLYMVGIIGNIDHVKGKPRFFWSFRQEEYLDYEMPVTVHDGLLNYFNIRHR